MKYLYIDYAAIVIITSNRKFQSYEYDDSIKLIEFLSGKIKSFSFHRLNLVKSKDGLFIYVDSYRDKGVVFDFLNFTAFQNCDFKGEDLITILQKTLKFCIKFWNKNPLSSCEKNIKDTNHSLIYPLPYSTGDSYRIYVDKNPDKKKQLSRNREFLLVYKDSFSRYDKEPSVSIFRKAIKESNTECVVTNEVGGLHQEEESLKVLNLINRQNSIDAYIGFEQWKHLLTINQSKFVNKDINGPERLEGAAGTGKTLSMILRCINLIKKYKEKSETLNLIFFTHSIASKEQIENVFRANFPEYNDFINRGYSKQTIYVITLQEWCLSFLGGYIQSSEYLDLDAQDSKELQLMYIQQALDSAIEKDFETYKEISSKQFIEYIIDSYENNKEELIELLQHEIAVTIKGRAQEDLNTYINLRRIQYTIPVDNKYEGDLNFLFLIYKKYMKSLDDVNQFDSDDIAITSLQQLNTPIWRRRKSQEGYDAIFIDETHLFNLNEISIFHHLIKDQSRNNIIFAMDRSQAVGEMGTTKENLERKMNFKNNTSGVKFKTVFRSSPQIVSLAFNILSSGASLFLSLENPLEKVNYSFTKEEEEKSEIPKYFFEVSNDKIVEKAFSIAQDLKHEKKISRSKILIVAVNSEMLSNIEKYARKTNKSVEILKRRGDVGLIKKAEKNNRFVVGGIDFVGGLEFDVVIICGVDKGRVPANSNSSSETRHFIKYAWHNRLYVAISRAKYIINLIGLESTGESEMLKSAINNKLIEVKKN